MKNIFSFSSDESIFWVKPKIQNATHSIQIKYQSKGLPKMADFAWLYPKRIK